MTNTNKNASFYGIGNDIIEIDRIKKSIEHHKESFIKRIFTENESKYCLSFKNPYPRFAGRFAAKEAIVKALKVGIGEHISWLDISIKNKENGCPEVTLLNNKFSNFDISISISHCENYATAFAICFCN
jgi:holo-[acyl-carrier protein] synthase